MFSGKTLRCDCGYEVRAHDDAGFVETIRDTPGRRTGSSSPVTAHLEPRHNLGGAITTQRSARPIKKEETVNHYDPDLLRLLTREHHERRRREGDAERLARQIRGTTPRRRRLPQILRLALATARRTAQPRLQA